MEWIKENEFIEIINELPDISKLDYKKEFSNTEWDLFLCGLGFEERCLTIPEKLAELQDFKCNKVFYFEYSTNKEDNETNKPRLIECFKKFSNSWDFFQVDAGDFPKRLRAIMKDLTTTKITPKVIFDISVCSSKLLLLTMKILLEFDIHLKIVYSEAAIYHPTIEEYEKEPQKWITEEGFGLARGVGEVICSPEHPGARQENPHLVIAFLTFKPERTQAIITHIDETILTTFNKTIGRRLICIVGDPHMENEARNKRKEMMKEINREILGLEGVVSYEISTFDYKDTIKRLEQIYKEKYLDFHINISALGSKMQSLGIANFCYVRPDVSVYLALPKEYNPRQYSEGCKAIWEIDFGNMGRIKNLLNKVDQIEIKQNKRDYKYGKC